MCGRYRLVMADSEMEEILAAINRQPLADSAPHAVPIWNVSPASTVPVLGPEGARLMKWGFPPVGEGRRLVINARQETAAASPYFQGSLAHRRIAVPTSGFYEWMHDGRNKPTAQYGFLRPNKAALYLAGMYDFFFLPTGEREERFVILTTAANRAMQAFHHRMPVCLEEEEIFSWLTDDACVEGILRREQPRLEAQFVGADGREKAEQMNMFFC